MNEVVYRLSLDIHETSSQAVIPIKRDDNNRLLLFTLHEDGKQYVITPDCTARLRARKSNGDVLFNDCEIENSVIKYGLTSQTAAEIGLVECEITLYGADERQITSPRFELVVDDVVLGDEEIESHDEFTALQNALDRYDSGATISGITVDVANEALEIKLSKEVPVEVVEVE